MLGGKQLVNQQVNEEEVSEVIDGKLHLDAIYGLIVRRHSHDASGTYDGVEDRNRADDLGGGFAGCLQRGEIKHDRLYNCAMWYIQGLDHVLQFVGRSTGEDENGWLLSYDGSSRVEAEGIRTNASYEN